MQYVPKWLVQAIAGLLTLLLLVVTISQLYTVRDKSKQVNDKNVITISAQGKVTAKPDLVNITAAVSTEADTAVNAQNDNAQKMNKAIEYIKSQGVKSDDIRTTDYNVYPKYDYKDGSSKLVGYTANQTVVVKFRDFSKLGNVLDGMAKNGINQIQSVNYTFENVDDFRQQAREMALGSAKDKATKLANAAGVKLGKLVSFSENSVGGVQPYYMDGRGAGGMGGAAPQTEPGTQEITAEVSVTYEIQ